MQSIRGRIALLLALAFLPAGGVAVQAGLSSLAAREAAVQESAGASELQAMGAARGEVTQLREVTRTLAANAHLFAADMRVCRQTLSGFVGEFPELSIVSLLDAEGQVICANVEAAQGRRVAAGELIERADAGEEVAVDFIATPRLTSAAAIAAVSRAQVSDAMPSLYIGVTRPVAPLLGRVSGEGDPYAALLDQEGRILDLAGLDAQSSEGRRLTTLLGDADVSRLATARRVGETWIVVTPLEADRLYLLRGWSPAPTNWAERMRAIWSLFSPILLWIAAVAAAWYAVELFVARPLLVVERLARAYARGEDAEADENLLRSAPAEIASLRRTMMAMAKTLRGREMRLAEALQEERALLREVNHRVKNNLQMVASLLSIQERAAEDKGEARALARAKARVQLLALAHSRTYASGALRDVALDQLAGDIGRTVIAARGAAFSHVGLGLELEPARASTDIALPIAFLIGETMADMLDCLPEDGVPRKVVMRLERTENALRFELCAPGLDAAAFARGNGRIIEAFAKQLNAVVARAPDGDCFVRIELPSGAKVALEEIDA